MRRGATAVAFGCASVLLSYPDDNFSSDLSAVAAASSRLPRGKVRSSLEGARQWLAATPTIEAAARYVETFDLRRRCSLHLTYYRHGDTRERGMALSALAAAYRDMGFRLSAGELPDYLPALLELAAVSRAGAAILGEHRAALDALAEALEDAESGYAGVVAAVSLLLGAPRRSEREALRRYRADGPRSERVGLEPFAPPEVIAHGVTQR
jgi:nitrate reductase delta subunit